MGNKPNITLEDEMASKVPKKEDPDIPADKKSERSFNEEIKHGHPSSSRAFKRESMSPQAFRTVPKKEMKPDNKPIPTTPVRQVAAALSTPKTPRHASSPPPALSSPTTARHASPSPALATSKTHHLASSETLSYPGIHEIPETPRRDRLYPMSAKKANNLIEHGVHPFNPPSSPGPETGQLPLSVMSNKRRPELETPPLPKKPRSAQSPPRPRSAGHGIASSPPGPGSALGKLAIRAKHRHRRFGYELPPKMEDLELGRPGVDPKPGRFERRMLKMDAASEADEVEGEGQMEVGGVGHFKGKKKERGGKDGRK